MSVETEMYTHNIPVCTRFCNWRLPSSLHTRRRRWTCKVFGNDQLAKITQPSVKRIEEAWENVEKSYESTKGSQKQIEIHIPENHSHFIIEATGSNKIKEPQIKMEEAKIRYLGVILLWVDHDTHIKRRISAQQNLESQAYYSDRALFYGVRDLGGERWSDFRSKIKPFLLEIRRAYNSNRYICKPRLRQ